jgi:hypothetical protein
MSFLNTITKLAMTVGEALSGNALPAVIEIGKDVLNLIDEAKTVVATDDVVVLQATRDELEPKVMAHADSTEKELRGS